MTWNASHRYGECCRKCINAPFMAKYGLSVGKVINEREIHEGIIARDAHRSSPTESQIHIPSMGGCPE
jgi:hypothetical protein